MSTVSEPRPQPRLRVVPPQAIGAPNDGSFWCAAIGSGLTVVVELALHLDIMSASIAHLPQRTALTRPAVGHYLDAVKTLADNWRARLRPALATTADALASAGACITGQALRKSGTPRARSAKPAGALVPVVSRRLDSAIVLLDAMSSELNQALELITRASRELDSDTVQLTQRMQADQVHALMLSQQASTLQSKLDDATMRQHAYWLLGPHAEQIRQEIAMHSSAREGVRRQLDHLRAEQTAAQAEARYLQHLLPSLSTYLAALDRLGAALRAILGGSRALLGSWREQAATDDLSAQLLAAAPHWQALALTAERLRQPVQGCGIMTPDGCRT